MYRVQEDYKGDETHMPTEELTNDIRAGKYDDFIGIENENVKIRNGEMYEKKSETNFEIHPVGGLYKDDLGDEYCIRVYHNGEEFVSSTEYGEESFSDQLPDYIERVKEMFM